MKITIELDTDDTDDRVEALLTVLGHGATLATVTPEPVEEAKPAPAKKAAAKKTTAKKAAAKPEPEEDEDEDEDLIGASQPTLQDAVELAGKLVASGKAADVKATLKELGVGRVSQLDGDDEAIAAFVSKLG